MHSADLCSRELPSSIWHVPNSIFELNPLSRIFQYIISTTNTCLPETGEGHKQKTLIFSMKDIPASASKENLELFGSASVGGQPSHRETYSHSSFTARQSNHYGSPNPFGTPPPDDLSHHQRTSIFERYQGGPRSAPQHLNPHPTGGNLTNWNPTIPETVLTPLLTLQIDTTRAMMDPTPNLVAQMAPMDQEDQMVLADPATILPTSKTSCGNS